MKSYKKIIAAILVGLSVTSGFAKAKFRTLDQIKKSKTIKIAVFSDKKPFGYVDENGKYQGYDSYFANRIAQDLDVKVKFVSVTAEERIEALDSGKADLVLANFTVTPDRAAKVDFALPYMKCALGVISNQKKDYITNVKQLNGKTLIVVKGSTAEEYFAKKHPEVKLLKFDQYSDAFKALLDGKGAALSTDNTEALAWANENAGYSVGIGSIGNISAIAPAVAKENTTLLNWINEEIKSLAKEQFFHADYELTLRKSYGPNSDADSLVVEGGIIK